jgi:hypothetical protein
MVALKFMGVRNMSYQNDSKKGGSNPKSGGNQKNPQGQNPGQQGQVSGANFHPQDIKSLVHNQGRTKLGGQEWALKAPSWNDSALQAIISDPQFTAKPAGAPPSDGKWTYELCGHGKTIQVTIGR